MTGLLFIRGRWVSIPKINVPGKCETHQKRFRSFVTSTMEEIYEIHIFV